MKRIYFIALIISIFAVLAVSCDLEGTEEPLSYPVYNGIPAQENKIFFAQNAENNNFYELSAKWLAYNSLCEVWAEAGSGVTAAQAKKIADKYIEIYNKLMNGLGWTYNINGTLMNTMQCADSLGDQNSRLIILLLDIKDGYTEGSGYVAGYFWGGNLYKRDSEDYQYSNECDMIYMDIYPGKIDTDEFYKTLAHEMQHLMNFTTTLLYHSNGWRSGLMDTWIDEGLSSAAEWIYSGEQNQGRVKWYNTDSTKYIAKGDNFYMWDNYYNKDPEALLNDYATVYLFFQWLRLSVNDNNGDVYRRIFQAHYNDYMAVKSQYNNTWSDLLEKWHAANYLNNASGVFGYGNDPVLKNVKAHNIGAGNYTEKNGNKYWQLYPGEAVYSHSINGRPLPANSTNIKYASPGSQGNSVPAGGTLLAYNINTNNKSAGNSDECIVTGESPPANAKNITSFMGNFNLTDTQAVPHQISAGEMLRRRGFDQNVSYVLMPSADNKNNGYSRSTNNNSLIIRDYNEEQLPKYTVADE